MHKRIITLFTVMLLTVLTMTTCGRYYTCDIAGYIKDKDSDNGINGARIRLYQTEPATADADGYFVDTPSMTSGGNAGYFTHKIIWSNIFGSFGDEGDTGEIWIGITHEDYVSVIEQRTGLLSDTLNVVADIKMLRASFEMTSLKGRIVDSTGTGVNGVRVVLDLESTTDDTTDYIAITRTNNGDDGVFTFNNIRWRDDTADTNSTDTENAFIYIDDTNYNSTYNIDNMLPVVLASDDEAELANTIIVTREPRTTFSANIQGRCFYRLGTTPDIQEFSIRGVEVTLTYTDDNGAHTLYTQTNANGTYTFAIEWEEDPPADNGSGLTTIPEGEDVIAVTVHFTSPNPPVAGNVYTFSDFTGYFIKSWLNPNYLPDSIDSNMGA